MIDPGHASVGTLHLNSTFVQGASGSTRIDLGSTGNDQLSITGAATLAGTLRVSEFRRVYSAAGAGVYGDDVCVEELGM